MKKYKIKSVIMINKEWKDQENGNTYFATKIHCNFGMKSFKTLYNKIQYGYGTQFSCEGKKLIKDNYFGSISDCWAKDSYREINIENCTREDVERWGTQ